jgi:predicted metalloprotease with PDZ domain
MIHYLFSYKKAYKHLIDIDLTVQTNGDKKLSFQIPAWRPGRYELGDFAKNIQKWNAFDENGNELPFQKTTKDCWKVECHNASSVTITYNYYANELDAGSTYLDENQLYVNPVNCCMYVVGRENSACQLELEIPSGYKIACGMKMNDDGYLLANSFDQLAESPFIASNSLLHDEYIVDGITYHLWIQGKYKPDFEKVKADFIGFTKAQVECFKSLPVDDYHFLFQITPYASYHGVEHTNSTVILMGDKEDVFKTKYDNILGICSHELYHTWNIKAIRPKEMLPYDYTKENYSKLGYVAEGVTTYMGDLMLKRGHVFNWEQFIKTQNENLKRHYENDGRHNLSVADSAFDTWLDGYSLGVPNRKTSIYADGALNMLMIDLFIIKHSESKHSLNDVMTELYEDYRNSGYTEDDFQQLCVKYGGLKVSEVFNNHIYGTEEYTKTLTEALSYVGFELVKTKNPSLSAHKFGFISIVQNGKHIIKKIQNTCEAESNGIAVDDEILTVNGTVVNDSKLNDIIKDTDEVVTLEIKKRFETIKVKLASGDFYPIYTLKMLDKASDEQLILRKVWAK